MLKSLGAAMMAACLSLVCASTAIADPPDVEKAHRAGAYVSVCVKETVISLMRAGDGDRDEIKEMAVSRCAGTFYNNGIMPKAEAIRFVASEADLEIDNMVHRAAR